MIFLVAWRVRFSQNYARISARFSHRRRQDRGRFSGTAHIELFYLASPSHLAFRLLPYGLSVMRRRIGQSFADDPLNGANGAFRIVYAQPDTIGIAEIKLGEVAVQVFLAATLVNAFHAALENRIVALHGVGIDRIACLAIAVAVLFSRMINRVMSGKLLAELAINSCDSSVMTCDFAAMFAFTIGIISPLVARSTWNERAEPPRSTRVRTAFLWPRPGARFRDAFLAPDIGFIDLDDATPAAHWCQAAIAHGLSDAMTHEPCGFEGHAKVRESWLVENPFLEEQRGTWLEARCSLGHDYLQRSCQSLP